MSVVIPPIFTGMDDQEFGENRPVSEETVRKLVHNVNLLGSLGLIGSIRAISVNTPGVPIPSSKQFQLTDGTEITDPDSPLRTISGPARLTPKLNDKYIRGASTTTSNTDTGDLAPGASVTRNLSHNHGETGDVFSSPVGNPGSNRKGYLPGNIAHHHDTANDLSATDPVELANVQTAYYLKIN